MSGHHGWRTYYGHTVNNCLALLVGVYKMRGCEGYYTDQTQTLLSTWTGLPQQRISDILADHNRGRDTREVRYYAQNCDCEERDIKTILSAFGGTSHSMLEITARKYGYRFATNVRPGCLIDVYDYDPFLGAEDFEEGVLWYE